MIAINRDPTRKQLVQFGFIWMGFVATFGAISHFRFDRPVVAIVLWALAVIVPVIGWLSPGFMRLVFVGMSYLAWPIGFVVSHVVLALVYYLVVTPVGLLMRLVGYDPMKRRFDPAASSYWLARETGDGDARRYFRQF
jgi:fatty acid desaturase